MEKETIEQAAKYYAHNYFVMQETNNYKALKQVFEAGAKWQQEQDNKMYSEEEVLELLNDLRLHTYNYGMGRIELLEWFEQFKNK
jgi:hypothetical protein